MFIKRISAVLPDSGCVPAPLCLLATADHNFYSESERRRRIIALFLLFILLVHNSYHSMKAVQFFTKTLNIPAPNIYTILS